MDGLALAQQSLKHYPEALKLYQESLNVKIRMYIEVDLSVIFKQRILEPQDLGIASSLKNRGNALLKCDRLEDALNAFTTAVKTERVVFHDYHKCIASSLKTTSTILGCLDAGRRATLPEMTTCTLSRR